MNNKILASKHDFYQKKHLLKFLIIYDLINMDPQYRKFLRLSDKSS